MIEEMAILKEITRLQELLGSLYQRDKHISAAMFHVSQKLDRQINALLKKSNEFNKPTEPPWV